MHCNSVMNVVSAGCAAGVYDKNYYGWRGGSKRLQGKSIREFYGQALISCTIEAAQTSK